MPIVSHAIYGIPQTINTANYVYFLALQEVGRLTVETEQTDGTEGKSRALAEDKLYEIVTGKIIAASCP